MGGCSEASPEQRLLAVSSYCTAITWSTPGLALVGPGLLVACPAQPPPPPLLLRSRCSQLGYKQELKREFNLWKNFGVTFGNLSMLTALGGFYYFGFTYVSCSAAAASAPVMPASSQWQCGRHPDCKATNWNAAAVCWVQGGPVVCIWGW